MLTATILLMGLGVAASIMLAIASKIFYVWEDPRIERVEEALLGANCGGCGYAGCSAAAEAVVFGKAKADICVAGGFEIAKGVAEVMGMTVEEKEPEISSTSCTFGYQDADLKFNYAGLPDCRAAMMLFGGSKECNIGCLGLGTCVRVCPFDALSMGEDNLPVVNKDKCTSCGLCAENCPKEIITITSAAKRIISDYKVSECTAPCQRTCPAEIDIPEYIRHIANADYIGAVRVIKEKNPFPLVCGWLCPAPCESECRRNLIDEPVTINALKKFVSNYEMETGQRADIYLPPASGKKVAVIGGGVQGLTSAYYLRRLGHQPRILEATDQLGGILRHVITQDRLPRDVIDWDVNGILDIGVEAEKGKVMGKDFSLSSLFQEGMDMVLLTAGGWDSRQIMRGKTWGKTMLPSTHLMLDFLIASSKNQEVKVGENVVILGGGKTAARTADLCLEKGAKEVTLVFPYSQERAENYDVNVRELKNKKNLNLVYSAYPIELQGQGDHLKNITLRIEQSRGKLMAIKEVKTMELSLDHLIVGSGRFPEMLFVKSQPEEGEVETYEWKTVEIAPVFPSETNLGIFAVSESGRPTDLTGVVVAVKRGRKAMRAIHLYATGEEISPQDGVILDEKQLQNVDSVQNVEDLAFPRKNMDNKVTLTEEETQVEAGRCLECGLICYKKTLNLDKNRVNPDENSKNEKSA